MSSAVDTRPGPLRETGRMTDLALQGRGFFVVQTPQGEMYTRNGRFTVDAQGRLVNGSGLPVLGSGGPLEVEGSFVVERDGTLTAGGNVIGRLQVVDFADAGRLEHRGESLLAAPRGVAAEPLAPEQVEMVQGQLEGSNVDPVMTLVAMIAAQRAFEIESRLMQASDENLDKAVNQLPAVR
jgi:flagellar basal body rod protein FlgG